MHCSPSSPRKGSCRLIALLGRAGTTILLWENIIVCLLCFALLVSTKASKSFRKGSEKPQNAFFWKIVLDRLQFCYRSFVKFHCLSMNKLVNAKTTNLSRSSSFLSHSKSENLLLTLDSFTRNTGRFVCKWNQLKFLRNKFLRLHLYILPQVFNSCFRLHSSWYQIISSDPQTIRLSNHHIIR